VNRIESPLTTNAVNGKELKKLREVSQDFEEMFVAMVLKELHKPLGNTGFLDNGPYEKMFRDLLIDERAKEMAANGGLGLADLMVRQLEPVVAANGGKAGREILSAGSQAAKMYARQEKYVADPTALSILSGNQR
jgi:flagellar protein FlgJ